MADYNNCGLAVSRKATNSTVQSFNKLQVDQSLDVVNAGFALFLDALLRTAKHSGSELALPFLQLLHPLLHRAFHYKLPQDHTDVYLDRLVGFNVPPNT